jgi:hypothetical protein
MLNRPKIVINVTPFLVLTILNLNGSAEPRGCTNSRLSTTHSLLVANAILKTRRTAPFPNGDIGLLRCSTWPYWKLQSTARQGSRRAFYSPRNGAGFNTSDARKGCHLSISGG